MTAVADTDRRRPADDGSPRARVLCVDDEQAVLDGLARQLRQHFDVTTACGPMAGLETISHAEEPFAVIMSDMLMPGMDGATFLAHAHHRSPDSVRVLLTGHADMDKAIAAVNKGRIFRFLTKPCPRDDLIETLDDAAEQFRLITAERELLEKTLRSSVAALLETLSLANPMAFARASRITRTVKELVAATDAPDAWMIEIAAMLSQIGAVTLPQEIIAKLHSGERLDEGEQMLVEKLPSTAERILGGIPRLDAVREIIRQSPRPFDGKGQPPSAPKEEGLPLGSRMLRIALDLDPLEAQGLERDRAVAVLRDAAGAYDPNLLDALEGTAGPTVVLEIAARELTIGMILARDVTDANGVLLVGNGHEVTPSLIDRLHNWAVRGVVAEPLYVRVPGLR